MRREEQIAETGKLLRHRDERTTAPADGIYRHPVAACTGSALAPARPNLAAE